MTDRLSAIAPTPDPATDAGEVARAELEFRIAEGTEPAGDLLESLAALLIGMEHGKPHGNPDVTRCPL